MKTGELPDSDVEAVLRRARVSPPPPELKGRILAAAETAWREPSAVPRDAWDWATVLLELAAAAVILLAGLQVNARLTGPSASPAVAAVAASPEWTGDMLSLLPLWSHPKAAPDPAVLSQVLRARRDLLRELLPERATARDARKGAVSSGPASAFVDKAA